MDNLFTFLVESKLLNFSIFVIILLVFQQKFFEKKWQENNKDIEAELEEAKRVQLEAQNQLARSKRKLEDFGKEVSNIKAEHEKVINSLKESLEQENIKKLNQLKHQYQQELSRLHSINEDEVRQKIIETSIELVKDAMKTSKQDSGFSAKAIAELQLAKDKMKG